MLAPTWIRFTYLGLLTCLVAQTGECELIFNRDVRPILSEHCFTCHGPDRATREADLRLDVSDSAEGVIEPGNLDASELVRRIRSTDRDEMMPPPHGTKKALSEVERRTLERWIEEGADYQQHWAFIAPTASNPPQHERDEWSRNPIDQFVLSKLRERNIEPSPRASEETLLRRITLDLTGLPPTPEEIRAFLKDAQGQLHVAIDRLIDRLMNSSRYGEHMALPWLEAARYADTDGYQNDRYRYQHAWRDWVIQAFNDNMPYDQFVTEQLAGDMLPNATLTQQIASGFGRNHRINSEDGSIPEEWRIENVVDRVDTFGTVFLGLTVGCARCHDHKYDPISQKEYYQLFAYFNNVAEWGVGPNNGNSPPFIEVPASWPNLTPTENRFVEPDPVQLANARKVAGNGLQRPQAGSPTTVMVMHELEEPRPAYVLIRGQYNEPDLSQPVSPAVPTAMATNSKTPSNRLELAEWLFEDDHPLTARVAVNRLWQQYFGTGLVESSDNFGSQGSLPSHAALLDWLAIELIRNDWDLRAVQKLILRSATYQQSSRVTKELNERDPGNRLLARGARIRLPAFTIRDQALAISGLLVEKIGGPSAKPYMPPKIWSAISNNKYVQDKGANLYRRSLYTYWRRTIPPPTMMNFNAAAREVCIVRTESTNTPLQALTLMNNQVFVESAAHMAQRMLHSHDLTRKQIQYGFQLACGRLPLRDELRVLLESHKQFLNDYKLDQPAANKLVGVLTTRRDQAISYPQHAAMTMVASLILNLDETITKE